MIDEKLQIILITYNRAARVEDTLKVLFEKNTPIKDCEFLVLDNNSTDNTKELVNSWQVRYPNIKYQKNRYNVGIAGNILKAMEIASKDYVWIIGDDDRYDFSNWSEVEKAIENNEKIICLAKYAIQDKKSIPQQMLQLTFITGGIYNTSLFNDTVMRNAYDNIYTLFPHLAPVCFHLNNKGNIYVVEKAIADNGGLNNSEDCSYIRGIKSSADLSDRTKMMSWILGYCNVLTILNDKTLISECIDAANAFSGISSGRKRFYKYLHNLLRLRKRNYFFDIYNNLSFSERLRFSLFSFYFKLLDLFLLIINDEDGVYKTIRILGFSFKIKRRVKSCSGAIMLGGLDD